MNVNNAGLPQQIENQGNYYPPYVIYNRHLKQKRASRPFFVLYAFTLPLTFAITSSAMLLGAGE